jgi:putative aldouronate transport system substrate-binding protein
MPVGVSSEGRDLTWSPDIRWDLYKKAGMPRIKTLEDYLPVLKKMQELEPKNESGKPVYGFTLFADWDGDKMTTAKQFVHLYGYDEFGFIFIHATESKYQHVLQPDGLYMRGLKLYFNANKMGLLDPDSISQKWSDVWTKFVDGRVLFSWWWWLGQSAYNTPERTALGKGFQCVPAEDQKVLSLGFDPYGGTRVIAIGAKTKYPERVMEFINWLYTTDGLMTRTNGPENLTWELRDGRLTMTDFGWKCYEDQENTVVPDEWGGGTFGGGTDQVNFPAIMFTTVEKKYKEPIDHNIWTTSLERNPSKLVEDWRKTMGAMTSKDYLVKNNMVIVKPAVYYTQTPMAMSDDIQQKYNLIQPVIKQYSWKMCFAANDKEFDTLYKEMVSKAKGLGYDDVLAFWAARATREIFEPRKASGK